MLEVEAYYVLGVTEYWRGNLLASRRHLEHALERYDRSRARQHLQLYAQDPGVICGVRLALTLWHLGEVERAHRLCLDTLADAEAVGHPFSLAYARYWGAWVLIEVGDTAELRRQIVGLNRDAIEYGLAVWPAMSAVLEGWLRTEDGDSDGGIEIMREGVAAYRSVQVSLGLPYQQGLLARACRRAGRAEEALRAVDAGLVDSRRTGENFWDAELLRVRGELLLERGSVAESRDALRRAREVASEQGARTLEERAAVALARLGNPAA
jgi:predicted ATPase